MVCFAPREGEMLYMPLLLRLTCLPAHKPVSVTHTSQHAAQEGTGMWMCCSLEP